MSQFCLIYWSLYQDVRRKYLSIRRNSACCKINIKFQQNTKDLFWDTEVYTNHRCFEKTYSAKSCSLFANLCSINGAASILQDIEILPFEMRLNLTLCKLTWFIGLAAEMIAWRHKLSLCSLLTIYIFAVRRKGELGPTTFGYLTPSLRRTDKGALNDYLEHPEHINYSCLFNWWHHADYLHDDISTSCRAPWCDPCGRQFIERLAGKN